MPDRQSPKTGLTGAAFLKLCAIRRLSNGLQLNLHVLLRNLTNGMEMWISVADSLLCTASYSISAANSLLCSASYSISAADSLLCSASYSYPVGMKQISLLNSEHRTGLDKSRGWTDEERQGNPRRKNIWQ